MRSGIVLTAFTARGEALAARIADKTGGVTRKKGQSLSAWAEENFDTREALIFVGALGIAVRTVAPRLKSKAEDPAVICVDETGRWVIPVVSGHLGGANALARRIAALTGGEAVITTATDQNERFAVDLWAKMQGMAVRQTERIKTVSSKILRGEEIVIDCPRKIEGNTPEHVTTGSPGDVTVSYRPDRTPALQLVPRILTIGIGCRKGISAETLEEAFALFAQERKILPEAVAQAASIDIKREETGLRTFCDRRGWPLTFFDVQELKELPGMFTGSAFVENTVGVDNVCERSAVKASGGILIEKKFAYKGATFALAESRCHYDWRWTDG